MSLSDSDFLTPLLKWSRWSLFIIVLSGFHYRTVLSVDGWPHATADLSSYQGRPAGCAISPLCPLCVIAAWPERDPTGPCGPDAYLNLAAAALNLPQALSPGLSTITLTMSSKVISRKASITLTFCNHQRNPCKGHRMVLLGMTLPVTGHKLSRGSSPAPAKVQLVLPTSCGFQYPKRNWSQFSTFKRDN